LQIAVKRDGRLFGAMKYGFGVHLELVSLGDDFFEDQCDTSEEINRLQIIHGNWYL
jgi:hypothetical protein